MLVYSPITTPAKHVVHICERVGRQRCFHVHAVVPRLTSKPCCFYFHSEFQQRYVTVTISGKSFCSSTTVSKAFQGGGLESGFSKQRKNSDPLIMKSLVSSMGHSMRYLGIPLRSQNRSLRFSLPKQEMVSKIRWNRGSASWLKGTASAGAIFGLSVCFSSSEPVYCEASRENNNEKNDYDSSSVGSSHGKRVFTDYSITGIPGDGRCLFRSVAHGACLRSGKPSPSENFQRELADELRARIADEFVRRREETEWFVEGDFDTYVSRIRKPHVWGGEPELFMASHVLQMPITVYMFDENAGGLITIAEYGQEYGKEDPIRVLYHGFGHYDALQIPGKGGKKSRL